MSKAKIVGSRLKAVLLDRAEPQVGMVANENLRANLRAWEGDIGMNCFICQYLAMVDSRTKAVQLRIRSITIAALCNLQIFYI